MNNVTSIEVWSSKMENNATSVKVRKAAGGVRSALKRLSSVPGLSLQDEQDLSNLHRILGRLDERHRKILGFSSSAVRQPRKILFADQLSPEERQAVLDDMNEQHDPAA